MQKITIIGAGIVGLATALKLQEANPDLSITVLEKEPGVARHQTGNNSGVIHSGIYYKPGSLKAVNCRNGVQKLLDFCDEHAVPYELCGKVIVATSPDELGRLDDLFSRGTANGVPHLRYLSPEELSEIEPSVTGVRAIYSPTTGIIDYKEFSRKLAESIVQRGGQIHFKQEVRAFQKRSDEWIITTRKNEYSADRVINCAGLFSDRIAGIAGFPGDVSIIPFRGEYYTLRDSSRHLVHHLIYPVPDPRFPFLGVHFTRGINGQIEAGPNAVLAMAREGYRKTDIHPVELGGILTSPGFWKMARVYWRMGAGEYYRSYFKGAFVMALQKLIPEISREDLAPGGAGVRAQALHKSGKLLDDFVITGNDRFINVLNAPSPAATSSLSIGEHISARLLNG